MTANMFHGANNFQITGGQFHVNTTTTGSQPFQGPSTMTYQDIKLATPAAPTFFVGREKITEEAVAKLLQKEPAHLAILGAGGMGKTALALHIIKNADVKNKFHDKIFFVPCEISADATSLVHTVVQSLGLKVHEGKTGFEVLQTYLALAQRPILLILDNFETPWNGTGSQTAVINFIDQLLDYSSLFVILTMRAANGPGNRHWIKLGGSAGLPQLDINEAQQMFLSLIQYLKTHNPEKLDWILKELDGMPLAVVLIAQLQRQLDLGLDKLMDLWRKHKTAMLTNGSTDESRLTSVNVSINLSLKMIKKSNPECQKLLPVLSYLPNGLPAWNEHVNGLFQGSDSLFPVICIKQLLDFALLYQENNTLKFVLPIQEYIQREYPADKEHLNQIAAFYVKFMKEFGPDGTNDQNVVERHLDNILKILRQQFTMGASDDYLKAPTSITAYSKFFSKTVSLIETVLENQELYITGRIEWMRKRVRMNCWMGKYLEAKEEIQRIQTLLDSDMSALLSTTEKEEWRSICLQELGEILYREHKLIEAKTVLLKAKGAFEQMDNNLGQAQCLQCLGDICGVEHNLSEARAMLSDAKAAFEGIGDHFGQAQCLRSLGNICRVEHSYSEAKKMLSDAKAAFEQIGDHLGQAQCLWRLGDICGMERNFSEAKTMLSDAKVVFEQIGDQSSQAGCLRSLGDICGMEKNFAKAKKMFSDAKAAFEQIGAPSGQAQCLQSLGDICSVQHKFTEARTMLSDAKAAFEQIGDHFGQAHCLQSLGDLSRVERSYSEARTMLSDAKASFEQIGNQLGRAQCLQSLGAICGMEHNFSEARSILSDAKVVFEQIGDQSGQAWCLRSLGEICGVEHNFSEAKKMLSDAKAALEQIGDQLGQAQCLWSLGDISRVEHNFSEARSMLSAAKVVFEQIGDQSGQAWCLRSLGEICGVEHNFSEAKKMLSDAKAAFEQIGDQWAQAQCLQSLGEICGLEDNFSEARTMLSDAKAAFEQIDHQFGQAQCLLRLGDICRVEHSYPGARKMYSEAKAFFEQIGDQLGAGECLQHLENISTMENDIPPDSPTSKNKQIPNLKDALKGLNLSQRLFHGKKFKNTKQAK
ncbi:hypothetical protein D9757_012604 [Collybiopsis confluens]|uniref:AAA+ ATPase domain-containing protein n=1 Tax=Collybiopsis confluens TaxID=2823264 RepID=A0A8H5GHN6_9AGAR|nr:hypothetical protein D9757_012604 [Collybiopsis confluens]